MKSVLNESQIEQIAGAVNKSSIASKELKENLIDHLCCTVENEMAKGMDFETAYRVVSQRIYPNGLDEIQNETVYLLTSKGRKRLNRIVYISAFGAGTGMLASSLMKILHLPFAQLLLLVSFAIVLLAFLPAVFVMLSKQTSGKKMMFNILCFTGVLLLAVSAVFAAGHWPGLYLLIFAGIFCLYMGFFPLFFFRIFRKQQ